MNASKLMTLRPARRPASRLRSGFALIVSLSLMTLLLLLVLTLTILVRLELQTAKGNLYTEQAKQNALLAAYIAIGQLQKFAGPDQRVTTTADFTRTRDINDQATSLPSVDSSSTGKAFSYILSKSEGWYKDSTQPYGIPTPNSGVLYWTAVWGNGATPLSIYTGHDPTTGNISPYPVLLNYLISGDEGTSLTAQTNGVVGIPDTINFTADLGQAQNAIALTNGSITQSEWTGLTNNIIMKPTAGPNSTVPAIMLVGPVTAYSNSSAKPHYFAGNDSSKGKIKDYDSRLNDVIVPLVKINVPGETDSDVTVGRYAFWVGDEGVKAKYNMPDPYAGAEKAGGNITTTAPNAQPLRYRLGSVERAAIERFAENNLKQMDSYVSGVNNPNNYDKTAAAMLGQVLDQPQVALLDHNLVGWDNPQDPTETLKVHYHDYTTYSYGVLADALRGGLRYDLTAAFEPGPFSTAVFINPSNGLKGKAIIPANTTASATFTTEPGAVSIAQRNYADNSLFHGPAAPNVANPSQPGLLWDVLASYYAIAANNTSGSPIQMQPGNATQAGISPVILQARLKIGQTVDDQQNQYLALEPIFVLGNPYNYPITPPPGGLDIGFRINTNTNWEWGIHAIARNSDRVAPHGSGVGVYLGFDNTQNANIGGSNNSNFTGGYNGAYFYPQSAISNPTPVVGGVSYGGGTGTGVRPGYYPILKNPVSYPNFTFPVPGPAGSAGNSRFNSLLDQVAFHIPKTLANGSPLIFQPGEAIVFTLADEKSSNIGGKNLTVQFQPNVRYNQMSTTQRKITAVVGTTSSTQNLYYYNGTQVVPVLMQPGELASNVHYFMLRYVGINTGSSTLLSYAGNTTIPPSWNLRGSPSTPGQYVTNTTNTWPDAQFGYISTAWPSVAATVELRYDNVTITPNLTGDNGIVPYIATVSGSEFTTYQTTSHIALPGENVLQSITNFDLSGAGLPGKTYPNPAGYLSPNPSQGYRRQFLGSGGSTTVPTLTNGVLPVFLTSYVMAMALPGPMDPLYFAKDNASAGDAGQTTFTANSQVSYRTYMDFNIRAVNLSLPPWAALNNATTNPNTIINTTAFVTAPPFGRIWNQGPAIGGGSGDDVVQASFNPNDDLAYNTKDVGPNLAAFTGAGSTQLYSSPWGNSLASGGGVTPGQQFNVMFALPTRANAGSSGSQANIPNPNNPSQNLPDIPIMSLGQLQHADVTADDVWVSVGYQRGNAIGNSYYTPFVNRSSSMQTHTIQSGTLVNRMNSLSATNEGFTKVTTASGAIGVYDISYLINCALFDRYFFSTLAQASSSTLPANQRLKYAAGIVPTSSELGLNSGSTTVIDPVTHLAMFRAYAPARYMMIDGAFNVNSTSFEAWRAILSGMRNVALAQYGGSVDGGGTPTANGPRPVVYFPRQIASGNLASATVASRPTSMTSNQVFQPIKNGPGINPNPNSSDSTGQDAASYAGFRQLTDIDIDYLAMKIIQQIHSRGPFLSLAQFVNRRLTPPTAHSQAYQDPMSWSGALQAAIDLNFANAGSGFGNPSNSLNNFYQGAVNAGSNPTSPMGVNFTLLPADSQGGANNNQTYPEGSAPFGTSVYPMGSGDPNSRLVGIPGWLTQADLLQALAPILSVRSDTFIIRTYGEVISPDVTQGLGLDDSLAQDPTKILSRAWCEVVVQRVPDYLATDSGSLNDPSTTTGLNAPNPATGAGSTKPTLSPVNIAFGRRFKIVSVRWLSANDI